MNGQFAGQPTCSHPESKYKMEYSSLQEAWAWNEPKPQNSGNNLKGNKLCPQHSEYESSYFQCGNKHGSNTTHLPNKTHKSWAAKKSFIHEQHQCKQPVTAQAAALPTATQHWHTADATRCNTTRGATQQEAEPVQVLIHQQEPAGAELGWRNFQLHDRTLWINKQEAQLNKYFKSCWYISLNIWL